MKRDAIDMNYLVDNLVQLVRTPSPTGNTGAAVALMENAFGELGLATERTNKGALVVTMPGRSNARPRALSGHVDTLGAMVKEIKDSGRFKLTPLGGYLWQTVEGEYCEIETANGVTYTGTVLAHKTAVHTYSRAELAESKHTNDDIEVRLDAKTTTKAETLQLGIQIGDFVSFDPRAVVTETGFVKSRHLDDKAGVAIMLAAAKALLDANLKPAQTTTFYISPYEEVGHGAASGIPEPVRELLVVDMGALGDGQNSDEYTVSICAKDSSGPYDLGMRRKLVVLCQDHDIPYKVDIYPFYGSDGSAALRAGANLVVGLIGPGVDASHAFERTHKESLLHTARLAAAYLLAE
ncbi:MAG: M42 family metallopeptidase [Anaerolineae bacterium]|nr:M42 family metallopeptidase [Anaerolineae bacterium]